MMNKVDLNGPDLRAHSRDRFLTRINMASVLIMVVILLVEVAR